jgi:parallel beta-helix repeat protein
MSRKPAWTRTLSVLLAFFVAVAALSAAAPPTNITVTPSTATLEVGQTVKLTASMPGVSWLSANTAVATVTSGGVVTAVAPGSTIVTAKSKSSRGTSAITVNAPPPPPPPTEPPPTEPPPATEPPPTSVEPTFSEVIAGIRPRGFGASPYTVSTSARTYYVATNGSDTNPGVSSAPFRTINKAAQVAVAGDVVTIGDGTYTESVIVRNGGTATSPIVFQAANRGMVVLTGGNYVFGPVNWTGGLQNTGAIYVTVKGLTFRQYAPFGTTAEALRGIKGWRIEDCFFDAAGEQAMNLRGDDITLTRSTIQYSGRHAIIGYGPTGATWWYDPGFIGMRRAVVTDNIIRYNNTSVVTQAAVDGSAVVKFQAAVDMLVENNESYENWGPGFWLDGSNVGYMIRYNYFHDQLYRGSGYSPGRGLHLEISWNGTVRRNVFVNNAHEGLALNNVSGVLVEENYFSRNRRCIVTTNGARQAQFPLRDILIKNNQFRDWREYAAIEPLLNISASTAVPVLNVVADYNTYQPMTSKIHSGWWGYFISSVSQNCTDIGWECHGAVGTISLP